MEEQKEKPTKARYIISNLIAFLAFTFIIWDSLRHQFYLTALGVSLALLGYYISEWVRITHKRKFLTCVAGLFVVAGFACIIIHMFSK